MEWKANWLKPVRDTGDIAPLFQKDFSTTQQINSAMLYVTALGVYEANMNGSRIGDFILAPGWTSYRSRLQVQAYDVSEMMSNENHLEILVGKGWYRDNAIGWGRSQFQKELQEQPAGILAQLEITYADGNTEVLITDDSWGVVESAVRLSEIYNGEIYDASFVAKQRESVEIFNGPSHTLIEQQGEKITEHEHLAAACMFTTPRGETVIDFGQEITGYVETKVNATMGDIVDLSFAEVLDKDGNFYTENYRAAKSQYHYTCRDGVQTYKPKLTFYGFRYVRINAFPPSLEQVEKSCFTAIVVHSEMKRTGWVNSSNPLLNRLFDNCVWGQKGNFLDVPTDCPQRDERLGWTGDAQAFIKTACLNYDTERFFTKWLADMAADQRVDGYVGHVIPDVMQTEKPSAAWADAATICPWELYQAYGNPQILNQQFQCMRRWVDYITATTETPYLWIGGEHYGDWLGLDAPSGSYKGSTREDFIASAFYAHSTSLVIKAGEVLKIDVSAYKALYKNIVTAFRNNYPSYQTQTECVLAAHFHLAEDCPAAADQLKEMVLASGTKLQTGFVGTPYLLHVLSDYGYTELAYSLLLKQDYPSWLYPITKGATTIWEHWDGIMENGDFWSADMNSFNHYAYGAVLDWVYTKAAGICTVEEAPGYQAVSICPHPDQRLEWLDVSLETRHGMVRSKWRRDNGGWRYEIETPVKSTIIIDGKSKECSPGKYVFYTNDGLSI